MGCVDSRTSLPDEERSILIFENRFGFNSWSSQNIDFTIRRFSFNSEINSNHLENIIIHLMLPHLNNPHSKSIDAFYNSYRIANSNSFSLQKFLITGIMQGNASPSHKARLLFETKDPNCTGQITKAELQELIHDMLEVSLYHLPLLIDDLRHPPSSKRAVDDYIATIYANKDLCITEIEKILITGDLIKLKEFQDIINQQNNEGLITNHGIRMFCKKRSIPHKTLDLDRPLKHSEKSSSDSPKEDLPSEKTEVSYNS